MAAIGPNAAASCCGSLNPALCRQSAGMKRPPFLLQLPSPEPRSQRTRMIYCEVFGSLPLFAGENINCSRILGFSIYGCPYIFDDDDCECEDDDDDDDDCEEDDDDDDDCEDDDDDDDDCEDDDDDDDDDDCEDDDDDDDDDDCEEDDDDDDDDDCEEEDEDDDDDDDEECECD